MLTPPPVAAALQPNGTPPPRTPEKEPIAIVGMGCRFPGAVHSPAAFWQALKDEFDAITDVPADRWRAEAFYDPNPAKAGAIKARKGGFLGDVAAFDAGFFGIFPAEAERMDPQQRLLLEVAYETLENAGVRLEDIAGTPTGVYMGVFMNDYWDIQAATLQRDDISPHVPMGVSLTAIANRLSYVYNLKGPSMTIDTACSSSLVCVHLACRSIWSGESKQALAGGVNLILRPESSIMMSKGGFLSPDGYCKTFDSRANGYVRSEGCGMVLLKPLSQARADGDPIYALIRGSAVNQDGHTAEGFTVPSLEAQVEMLRSAYRDAGVDPRRVAYVEAHGTGTPVGDPIETRAFGTVLGEGRDPAHPCLVGSVKTNIGHLEAAAGIAGLIKLALVLQHRQIPANLHFEQPNPNIPFDQYRLQVPTRLLPIPAGDEPLYGGVNSFGAGGTNAHVVLEAYAAAPAPRPAEPAGAELFALSARSREALTAAVAQYLAFLDESTAPLGDICYAAGTRRSVHPHRLAVAARTKAGLAESLAAFLAGENRPGMSYAVAPGAKPRKVGFIYSGQGPQWYAMGQQLLESSPVFRAVILEIETLFARLAGWSLLEEMNRDEASSRVSDTRVAQPAIMAIQIGLTALWKSWGVTPAGVVGHSIGEVAAACAAGALTLEQAVAVIYHRSRGQNQATGKGKMLAVGMTLEQARREIRGLEDRVSVAAINGPAMLTLAGDAEPLEGLSARLEARNVFNRFLRVNVPFHSHHMEPLRDELIGSLAGLVPTPATLDLYSTVTGCREDGTHLVSAYWYRNVREPVYFTDALAQMIRDGYDTFIEIAPHPVLTEGALELFAAHNLKHGLVVPSLRRKEDEEITPKGSLGVLFTQGYAPDWNRLAGGVPRPFVPLPAYAWQRERYWFENQRHAEKRLGSTGHPYLEESYAGIAQAGQLGWAVDLNKNRHLYLDDHKVDGALVFPGTGHLEIAQAAARTSFPGRSPFLEDVRFEAALFLPEDGPAPEVRLELHSNEGDYTLFSRSRAEGDHPWTAHSTGRINHLGDAFASRPLDLETVRRRVGRSASVSDLYFELKEAGLHYGDTFRCIQKLWTGPGEVLAALSLHKRNAHEAPRYCFHPALLDACLHTLFATRPQVAEEKRGIYLPVRIDRYQLHAAPGGQVWTYIQVTEATDGYLGGNYWVWNEAGQLVAEIQGLRCKYIEGSRGEPADAAYAGTYAYGWHPVAREPAAPEPEARSLGSRLLVLAGRHPVAGYIVDQLRDRGEAPIVMRTGPHHGRPGPLDFVVDPDDQTAIAAVLGRLHETGISIGKVLYLWGLDEDTPPTAATPLLEQQAKLAGYTLNALRAVADSGTEPTLWIVTQGAESVIATDRDLNLGQAALYGLGRVMQNEHPLIGTRLVDVSLHFEPAEIHNLLAEVLGTASAPEVALRGDGVYRRQLDPVHAEGAAAAHQVSVPAVGGSYRAEVQEYGIIDSVVFRKMQRAAPRADEVQIEVRAAGLNFKDVMNVMGLLPDEAVAGGVAGKHLGLECAGVVTAVGPEVTGFKVGDAVMAWAPQCFAGYTTTREPCVVPKPAALSFEEAATMTVVYLTAYYSLHHLARIAAGDWVLVHSAAGGVGLAAFAVARRAGARVIATAGSAEKRQYLRSLGIEHVFDSRSLAFADEVRAATGGKGVDVVLNSLPGAAITQSIKCLAPFGTFIELGKADIYGKARLDLKRFGDNLSYHAVDLDRLMLQKPALGGRLYRELAALWASRQLPPLPLEVFPVARLTDALQFLSKGVHVGKVAVSLEKSGPVPVRAARQLALPADATYLVTGGASGFGLALAGWLAGRGARHLALVSRGGPKSDEDRAALRELEKGGVQVRLYQADVGAFADVARVVADLGRTMPPLRGIIHSAAVLDDATLANMDAARYGRVFAPKAVGAWNIHLAVGERPLDFFLMLSSISAVFGLPGQANYSAANNFLDKLALCRQQQGLAASSVNLGVLGDYAGMSKEGGQVINVLANQGWLPLTFGQATARIERILLEGPAQRMAANLDWKRFRDFFPHLAADTRFAHLMQEDPAKTGGGNTLPDQLRNAPDGERVGLLEDKLAEALAKILGTSAAKIVRDVSVAKMGLDSLMLNQLRNWIQLKLGVSYPLMKIAKGPTLGELAAQLLTEIGESPATAPGTDPSGIGGEGDVEVVGGWFIRNKHPRGPVRTRIFCFHPVGAGASMFSHFLYNAPEGAEVLAVQLPGRENRSGEPFYEDVPRLVADLAKAIQPMLDLPFVVFGHSFGGIIGFELVRYLRRHHGVTPAHLFVSGTIAPQLTRTWKERDVISETAVFANSEEKLLSLMSYIDDVAFLKRILPVMKRDMPLIMNYPYRPEAPFDFPVTGFAASQDEVVLPGEVSCWREQTTAEFNLETVDGDHWFLSRNQDFILGCVAEALAGIPV